MNTELFKSEESKLELYKDYIRQCTSASSSVENYSDFSLLDELIQKRYPNFTSLITIDDPNELQKIYDDLSKLPSFEEFNGKPNEGKPFKKIGNGQYHNALLTYIRFLNAIRLLNKGTIKITEKPDSLDKHIIFYGAPGTGKSFEVNKRVESLLAGMSEEEREKHKFRTTFHPDSDYASFVGCYKPKEVKSSVEEPDNAKGQLLSKDELVAKLKEYLKDSKNMTNAYVKFGHDFCDSLKNLEGNNAILDIVKEARGNQNSTTFDTTVRAGMQVFENSITNSLSESKITYSFVPQVFTNAYVAAWKAYAKPNVIINQSPSKPIVKINSDSYTLNAIIDTGTKGEAVKYTKVSLQEKDPFGNGVKKCWQALEDNPSANTKYMLPEAAICYWCKSNKPDIQSADDCWNAFLNDLNGGNTISSNASEKGSQTYSFSLKEGKIEIITNAHAYKNTICNTFYNINKETNTSDSSIQKAIALKLKGYKPFEQAWNKLKEEIINNYAQSSNIASSDSISQFLIIEEINRGNCAQVFGDLFQLLDRNNNGLSEYAIDADADLEEYIRKELEGCDGSKFPKGVKEGKKLVLPPNLYIWATMNTSDQSLFPMDSAFKRRWSWKYVPIDYSHKDSSKFEIDLGDEKYSWPNFLRKINEEIKNLTYSEDKQMGNFFIKHSIGLDEFRDKVMFYLWSEIGKENYKAKDAIFFYNDGGKESQEFSFNELYGDEEKATKILKGFMDYIDKKDDKFKDCSILKSEKKEQNQDTGSTPAVDSDEDI